MAVCYNALGDRNEEPGRPIQLVHASDERLPERRGYAMMRDCYDKYLPRSGLVNHPG
jgi:hypothetical protein